MAALQGGQQSLGLIGMVVGESRARCGLLWLMRASGLGWDTAVTRGQRGCELGSERRGCLLVSLPRLGTWPPGAGEAAGFLRLSPSSC